MLALGQRLGLVLGLRVEFPIEKITKTKKIFKKD